jgi:hypothetical protein
MQMKFMAKTAIKPGMILTSALFGATGRRESTGDKLISRREDINLIGHASQWIAAVSRPGLDQQVQYH